MAALAVCQPVLRAALAWMSRPWSAARAGARAEEQRLPFVQPGGVDAQGLIEENAVFGAQLPVRRWLADVPRFLQRLGDDVLEGLVNVDSDRMWRAGYNDDQIEIRGRVWHDGPFRGVAPGGRPHLLLGADDSVLSLPRRHSFGHE